MKLISVFLIALCCIFGEACSMRKVAEGLAWEAASRAGDYIYDHREDIADAVEHVQNERAKADQEAADRIKDAVDHGDYFDAAMAYEGSDRDPGDGCVIM